MPSAVLAVIDVSPDLDAFWAGVEMGGIIVGVVLGSLIVIGAIRRLIQV